VAGKVIVLIFVSVARFIRDAFVNMLDGVFILLVKSSVLKSPPEMMR
jgi:hypothetical protein